MKKKCMTFNEVRDETAQIMKVVVEICYRNNIPYYCQAGTVLGAVRHGGPIPWDYDADLIVPSNQIIRFVECCRRELPDKYWINYHTVSNSFAQFPRIGLKGYSTNNIHLDVFQLIGLPDDREGQLSMIREAWQYRDAMRAYVYSKEVLFSQIKHLQFRKCIKTISNKLRKDTSFVEKMDELCNRYSYENANYVMNPFGKYKEKNIFRKDVYGDGIMVDYLDYRVRIPTQTDFYLRQYYGDYSKLPSEEYIREQYARSFVIEESPYESV